MKMNEKYSSENFLLELCHFRDWGQTSKMSSSKSGQFYFVTFCWKSIFYPQGMPILSGLLIEKLDREPAETGL